MRLIALSKRNKNPKEQDMQTRPHTILSLILNTKMRRKTPSLDISVSLQPEYYHVQELKKLINSIEWDLSLITNKDVKTIKERQLIDYKKKLAELLMKKKMKLFQGGS